MVLKQSFFFILTISIFNNCLAQNSGINTFPKYFKGSDILFSKRMVNNTPAYEEYITTLGANRLAWHYNVINLLTEENLNKIKSSSVMKRFQTIDPNLQCSIPTYVKKVDNLDLQCKSLDGSTVIGSWETWGDIARGDVLKDAYRNLAAIFVVEMTKTGCKSFQQDALGQNMDTFRWGGCFSDEGDRKFIEFLRSHSATNILGEIIIDDNFKFSSFLKKYFDSNYSKLGLKRKEVINEKGDVEQIVDYKKIDLRLMMENPNFEYGLLLKLYRDFNAQETASHLNNLREAARNQLKQPVALSGNIYYADQDYELYNPLDYVLTELPDYLQNPKGLTYLASLGLKAGKDIAFTVPNSDLNLNRQAFASSYALGMHMLLPYDVYVGTNKPRLTIEPSKLSDLTDFIIANSTLLDNTYGLETYGKQSESLLTNVFSYQDRIAATHTMTNKMPYVEYKASVYIHGRILTTNSRSIIGNLYFPTSETEFLQQAMLNKWPVEKIINPDGTGNIFTSNVGLDKLPVTVVNRLDNSNFQTKFYNFSESLISAGSNYTIDGIKFSDVSNYTKKTDKLELAFNTRPPRLDSNLDKITNTLYFPGLNTSVPSDNAPRVKYIDFGLTKAGYTTIKTTYSSRDIPVNTKITFAQTGLETKTSGFNSGVGNFYLKGDLRDRIFIGQAILEISLGGQNMTNTFITKTQKPSVILDNDNVLVSVRKNSNSGIAINLVNWNNQPVSVNNMAIETNQLGLSNHASCSFTQVGNLTPTLVNLSSTENGYAKISLPEITTWGIISCNN